MQGTLNEIDLRSILQLIALGQRTGELLIEAHPIWAENHSPRVNDRQSFHNQPYLPKELWLVFFVNGQIVYTIKGQNSRCRRLREYLYRYRLELTSERLEKCQNLTHNDLEYQYLWQLIKDNCLTPNQGKTIIQQMVRETLFELLSLHHGFFIFEVGTGLDPLLTSLEIEPLVTKIMQEVQQWKQLHPYVQSPHQGVVITNQDKLQEALPKKVYEQLLHWANGKTSLGQLSRYLQRDLVTLAKGMYPYIERGWLQLVPSSSANLRSRPAAWAWTEPRNLPHVLCLDDDLTVGKQVEEMLTENGYQLSFISDSLQGLSAVFELNPDLILCDLAMPKLDGYEICAMLRHSSAFRHTPIIMLTGQEGFTDRIRARMVGATDYLTKPFGKQELLLLIEKYLTNQLGA